MSVRSIRTVADPVGHMNNFPSNHERHTRGPVANSRPMCAVVDFANLPYIDAQGIKLKRFSDTRTFLQGLLTCLRVVDVASPHFRN